MRSSSGPLSRRRWRASSASLQAQRSPSPANPQGHGLVAASSMKRAGWTAEWRARTIATRPSSSGWRSASSVARANSESSSRNSTPLCARTISPTRPRWAPPTSPAVVIEWCGARNGRARGSPSTALAGEAVDTRDFDRLLPGRAQAGSRGSGARASSCRCPAGRSAGRCGLRPQRSRARERRAAVRAPRRGRPRVWLRGAAVCRPGAPREEWRSARALGLPARPPRREGPRRSRDRGLPTSRASRAPLPASTSLAMPQRRAASATASAPWAGRTAPSSASSPSRARRASDSQEHWPAAASSAQAIARSSPAPALGRSPGARLAVMRPAGNRKPELRIAAWMRSRASRTAVSASPTTVNAGQAGAHVDLHAHMAHLQPVDRECVRPRQHRLQLLAARAKRRSLGRAWDGTLAPPAPIGRRGRASRVLARPGRYRPAGWRTT